jgi:hypothetical protein
MGTDMNGSGNGLMRAVSRVAAGICMFLLILAAPGCATQEQVKKIVADSNAQLAASRFEEIPLNPRPDDPRDDDAARRIEEFIAAHPDQKALIGSLRVRQAMIYLSRKQYNLAEAAFNAATDLQTDRDQALVAVHPSLIWWYENSATKFDDTKAKASISHRKAFSREARVRSASPEIRDFLSESGAWVGLKQFEATTKRIERKEIMEETMNDYAFILDGKDLEWLCRPSPMTDKTDMQAARRRVWAELVLDESAKQISTMDDKPKFASPMLQEILTRPGERCISRPRKKI